MTTQASSAPPAGTLALLLVGGQGVFTRGQALAAGFSDRDLKRWCRSRSLRRLRRGVYTCGTRWREADERERHALMARAALTWVGGDCYLTGITALMLHRVELFEPDLTVVSMVRDVASGRREAGIRHSDGELPAEHRREVDGLPVASVAWALVDYARTAALHQAVIAMDSAMRQGLVTLAEIKEVAERCRAWSGSRLVFAALRLVNPRCESVGESLSRVVFTLIGLPPDDIQVTIQTRRGKVRVDFMWRGRRVVGEFDGRVKYQRALLGDRDPAEVAWEERQRELAIEREGWVVVRFTWADLLQPALVRERLLQAFARAEALYGRAAAG